MTDIEEIDTWLNPRHPSRETNMTDDTTEMIPVSGIGDWFKGKIKNILLAYAKPFWDDIKAAVRDRDFGKLADVIDKIGALAGYAELAKAISDVFRELSAGNYLAAVEKAIVAVRMILDLFPKTEADSGPIRLMTSQTGTLTTAEGEIVAFVDAIFPSPTVAATGDEPPKTEFGIIEIAAIASLVWTAIQAAAAWRKKRKEQPPVVG